MKSDNRKFRILFLCTGNSCRSQMAEGWARYLLVGRVEPYSAGTEPHGLDPLAVKVMKEAGVDISNHESTHVGRYGEIPFDLVVAICSKAGENCPVFPGKAEVIHRGFDDPPKAAETARTEEEALEHYRRVRGEIRDFIIAEEDNWK